MQLFDLSGKTAVVTGGSRGLGRDMAHAFAEAGANVVIISRTEAPDVVKELEGYGVNAYSIAFDIGDLANHENLVKEIEEKVGDVHILLNNAGIQRRHPAEVFPLADWQEVLNVNTTAVFSLCQQFGKKMLAKGSGKIINIASLLSFQGGFTVPAYAASKGAVMQFTKSLANEWASKGINVNCIAPGYMATDMNEALIADETRSRQILERIPAGRWGSGTDMKGAAIFLASSASDYIHGFTIAVDGGWLGR
jgi:2-dehydro-3-deoxy-D-gluconate 5-dehydrogenase